MSDYPAGWYDDPKDEEHRERYWDGQGWTHDVRDKIAPGWYDDPKRFGMERYWDGVAWTDQQRYATRLDDVFIAVAIRRKENRLVVAGDHVSWGDDSIRWDDVTGFDTVTNLYQGYISSYRVEITGDGQKVVMEIAPDGKQDDRTANGFATIVDQAQRIVAPRILNDLFARADAGETIEYEKVSVSPQGFAKGRKDPIPWTEYGGWRHQNALFEVHRMKGDKAKVAVRAHTSQLGRWILAALLEDYSRRYSGADVAGSAP